MTHVSKGIFLGYTATMTNIVYYNLKTHHIKTAMHAHFDKGRKHLETPTPNVKQLRKALDKKLEGNEQKMTPLNELNLSSQNSPFKEIIYINLRIKYEHEHLGIIIESCQHRN